MEPRLAFTAKYWDDSAVVCRALENSAGPVVDQEFGLFETWTQACAYARKLNEGLEINLGEVRQIVTSSCLVTDEVVASAPSLEPQNSHSSSLEITRDLQTQFVLAQLHLALTFCRLNTAQSSNPYRLLRNARNAFFDGLHFVAHSKLSDSQVAMIIARLQALKVALWGASLEENFPLDPVRPGGG